MNTGKKKLLKSSVYLLMLIIHIKSSDYWVATPILNIKLITILIIQFAWVMDTRNPRIKKEPAGVVLYASPKVMRQSV